MCQGLKSSSTIYIIGHAVTTKWRSVSEHHESSANRISGAPKRADGCWLPMNHKQSPRVALEEPKVVIARAGCTTLVPLCVPTNAAGLARWS